MKNKLNLLIILCVWLIVVLGCASVPEKRQSSSNESIDVNNQPVLKLLSVNETTNLGYLTLTGEVQNISNQTLDDLWVTWNTYDVNGSILTTESFVAHTRNLRPNESTPFSFMTEQIGKVARYKLSFSNNNINGENYPYIDAPNAQAKRAKK